ncbi:Fc receptor 5 [Labeo rohita]|uniref:Fc receptor 5 n=1 Tax=Labeo rohita TaxID=84645 RepID=A0A498MB02_LABRO|nr:Fc receptor 5 [Labeo rohita]
MGAGRNNISLWEQVGTGQNLAEAGLKHESLAVLISNIYSQHTGGGRSQSPSSVNQQQNSSQTSEQNQSETGNKILLSGTAHIYDSIDATINKGGRSQSPSSVSQQQNSSQTSEQNQSETGNKILLSGTAHIFDSIDATINKDTQISTDIVSGATELTNAEIELKSTEKQKKKKENKVLISNIYSGHTEASSRRSGSDGLNPVIVGVSAGLTVTFFISVFLVLLWCYRNNKGGRSQSPSSVSQQQNSSQTSEQNQSETGNKTLMSDIVSGATELTYADIELKSTEKQKKKKENKGKTSESSDTVYSKLNLVTHQGYECSQHVNVNKVLISNINSGHTEAFDSGNFTSSKQVNQNNTS